MTARCSSCGAEIEWTLTENERPMPVDAVPTPVGNITIRMHRGPGEPGTAIYLNAEQKAELVAQAEHRLAEGISNQPALFFTSHFATCPNAAQHRRRG